jgi:hypothetical protein
MFGRIFFLATEYVIVCFGFGDGEGEGESKDEGMGSLDPAKPLIVSTAPFVSIRFQLMGTFRGNTQKIIWSREREREKEGDVDREREKETKKTNFFSRSVIHQSLCWAHRNCHTQKIAKRKTTKNTSRKFEENLC